MTVMICGSLAYDTVMVFNGRFKEHILPDRIHMLSVAFLVPQLRRNYGGCAGNIAYNLDLLGVKSHVLATVGDDFDPYETWMRRHGLSLEYVKRIPGTYTAQAFITTDLDDNQITAFHPGAMQHSGELEVPRGAGISLALVGPDGIDPDLGSRIVGAELQHPLVRGERRFVATDHAGLVALEQQLVDVDVPVAQIIGAQLVAVRMRLAALLKPSDSIFHPTLIDQIAALRQRRISGAAGGQRKQNKQYHSLHGESPVTIVCRWASGR
jgi:hypothetical protein